MWCSRRHMADDSGVEGMMGGLYGRTRLPMVADVHDSGGRSGSSDKPESSAEDLKQLKRELEQLKRELKTLSAVVADIKVKVERNKAR